MAHLRKLWEAASVEDADRYLQEQRDWCENESHIKSINESAKYTFETLKENKISHPDQPGSPWWPADLRNSSDTPLLETRRIFLRSRAYDTGITILLSELARRELIEVQTSQGAYLAELLLAQSYFGFNQMLALWRTKMLLPDEHRHLLKYDDNRLGEIAKLFGLEGPNRQLQFRLKKLVRFASVGFLVTSAGGRDVIIELGPVGRAFYEHAFVPIINHMPISKAVANEEVLT
jgi:hypothetical protein